MAYAADEKLPETFFVKTLMEKANMLKKHLKDTKSSLVICANIGPNMATSKLYNTKEEDSLNYTTQYQTISWGPNVPIMGANKLFTERTLSL